MTNIMINLIKLVLKYLSSFIKLRTIESVETFPILKTNIFTSLWKSKVCESRKAIWDYVINNFKNKNLDFFEFGVHEGKSIRYFSENLPGLKNTFTGFDSFIGLPNVYNHPSLSKGTFSTDGKTPKIDDRRVKFVKGFFNENKKIIREKLDKSENTKLVHFDADIYSSTLFILFQLDDHTPYYALFDEFGGDEARALYHYLISNDKNVEIIATTFDDKLKIVPRETFMKIY